MDGDGIGELEGDGIGDFEGDDNGKYFAREAAALRIQRPRVQTWPWAHWVNEAQGVHSGWKHESIAPRVITIIHLFVEQIMDRHVAQVGKFPLWNMRK